MNHGPTADCNIDRLPGSRSAPILIDFHANMKVLVFALAAIVSCLTTPVAESVGLRSTTRSEELTNLIESTLLDISDLSHLENTRGATGSIGSGATGATGATGVVERSKKISAAKNVSPTGNPSIAEQRVQAITKEATETAKLHTAVTSKKLDEIISRPERDSAFGNFVGDARALFDHDSELALKTASRNPLIAVDEHELRENGQISSDHVNPTNSPTGVAGPVRVQKSATGAAATGGIGKTGATGTAAQM